MLIKTLCQGAEGDWNQETNAQAGSLEVATWVPDMNGHRGIAAIQ